MATLQTVCFYLHISDVVATEISCLVRDLENCRIKPDLFLIYAKKTYQHV